MIGVEDIFGYGIYIAATSMIIGAIGNMIGVGSITLPLMLIALLAICMSILAYAYIVKTYMEHDQHDQHVGGAA